MNIEHKEHKAPRHNYNFEPLRIRAWMQACVISDQFLPLDTVLYRNVVREQQGAQVVTYANRSTVQEYTGLTLPFLKCGTHRDNNSWHYACSFAQFPQHTVEDKQTFNKRFAINRSDMIDFGKRKGQFEFAKGRYKQLHITVYCRSMLYIDWYAKGDKKELERLLPFCTHLGKKTSQGFGSVLRWDVKKWHADWSIRGERNGRKNQIMRAIPVRDGVSPYTYGIRPSYWNERHQFSCLLPLI